MMVPYGYFENQESIKIPSNLARLQRGDNCFIMKTDAHAKKCYEQQLPYDPDKIKVDKKKEKLRVLHMGGDNND